MKYVLAIETSCDDTSVALVAENGNVLSCISQSQDSSHAQFGGIVPEIASRNHTKFLMPLVEKILAEQNLIPSELAGLAVTNRPGLIGSLIVGVSTAKTLALLWDKPWIAVNHLEGHILAPFLKDATYQPSFSWDKPFLALAVSGGHTSLYLVRSLFDYELLGSSLDDAAGEAFDKFGKMLGLGFPGGVQVDRLAQTGDPTKFHFPRGLIKEDHLNMSFSGLKSASHRLLTSMTSDEIEANKNDLCASFQAAVVDALMAKLMKAEEQLKIGRVVVTGGVSANSGLRRAVENWSAKSGVQYLIPPLRFCTDNAAMIGLAGALHLKAGETSAMNLGPTPQALPTDFRISKDYLDAVTRIRRGAP